MSYKVKLDIFEGPLDLLLFLINKNEIDIYDIPIASITEQYLEYLDLMRSLNLDIAGEFLVMASTLIYIKSKMLLPLSYDLEEENIERDPRAELMERLLEYKKCKEGARWLSQQNLLGRDTFARSSLIMDLDRKKEEDRSLEDVSLIVLLDAFKDVLSRASKELTIDINISRLSIADRIQEVVEILKDKGPVEFHSLFDQPYSKSMVVITFLAILELIRLNMIKVYQTKVFGKILLTFKEKKAEDGKRRT